MLRRIFLTLTLVLPGAVALPAVAHAQAHEPHAETRFSGAWEITFGSQMGDMTWTLTVDWEDGALVGMAESEMGAAVVEGSQDGDLVEFTVFIDQPDHQVELLFSGTVDGHEASGGLDIMGEPFTWRAQKVDAR